MLLPLGGGPPRTRAGWVEGGQAYSVHWRRGRTAAAPSALVIPVKLPIRPPLPPPPFPTTKTKKNPGEIRRLFVNPGAMARRGTPGAPARRRRRALMFTW